MTNLKFLKNPLLYLAFATLSCTSDNTASPDSRSVLTAEKWYFFSVNGGEAYDCNKQTNMDFSNDGTLVIETYVRTPIYTCDGPFVKTYNYTLENNNSVLKFDGDVYNISKLTDTEFIKTKQGNDKIEEWVYRRYK
jgi:hypothetical protein